MVSATQPPSPSLLDTVNYVLFDYWEEAWDPRSRHMSFVSGGPWKMMAAMAFYVYFSAWLGPALMKNRKPFELRRAMLFYNISTVLMNTYFFIMSIYYLRFGLELFDFRFPSRDPSSLTQEDFVKANLVFFYILTKLYDLLDTIFFVLRKKNNQITGLHLYHHSVVPLLGWVVLKIAPTASCLGLFPLINCFVHIIMYSYYALASFGPSVQPYLWWKKYITQIQLAQFVLYGLYTLPFFALQEGYPLKFWSYVAGPQPFIFFYLFYRFYTNSYTKAKKKEASQEMDCQNNNNNTANNLNNNNQISQPKKEL